MPTVIVHYFAALREAKGCSQESVALRKGESAEALYRRLFSEGSSPFIPVAYAINQEYASGDTPLMDGDELAFIPPIGGG